MTAHDHEPDRHRETAVAAVARLLAPRLLPGMDAEHVARQAVDLLHGQGWRHIPRPERIPEPGRRDPDAYRAGAARAREELAKALAETEGGRP